MTDESERRRRHEAAMANAYRVLTGQPSDEDIAERSRKATQKARRMLDRLDAKQARDDAVRQRSQESTRRAREVLARLERREKYVDSLAGLNARLLSASASERQQIIAETIRENLRRWPTKKVWHGKSIPDPLWRGKRIK
jgi:hypothetical protein